MKESQNRLRYCLYARKSSEEEERQSASLESQIRMMTQKSIKQNLEIVEVIQESKSAKKTGKRDGYKKLLEGLENNAWNAVLTFSPDRLSRNAGDLGQLVDLMDDGRVMEVRTNDQVFKNTPDEKFLLMLLCGQAKLENDHRGINVKRGMRAVCHTGKRPGPTPLGYKLWYDLDKKNAPSKIIVDTKRAPYIQKLFTLVGINKFSTRDAMRILNNDGFTTTKGKPVSIGTIIKILHDPFYTGEFEYPKGSETWYQGTYEPILEKELYLAVQAQMKQTKKLLRQPLLSYICNKCICGLCREGFRYTIEEKETVIECKGFGCGNTMNKAQFIEKIVKNLLKQRRSKELDAKIERLEKIVRYFSDEKLTKKSVLTYLLSEGTRDVVYRSTKHIQTKILI